MGVLVVSALTLVFGLVSLVCSILILVHAFQNDGAAGGLLCMFVPFYIFYYALARFHHPRRGLVLGLWLGSVVGNIACQLLVVSMTSSGGPAYYY